MAIMQQDDYFGAGLVGMNPYAEQQQQKLDRLTAIDAIINKEGKGNASVTPGEGNQPVPKTQTATPQSFPPGMGGVFGGEPSGTPPGSVPAGPGYPPGSLRLPDGSIFLNPGTSTNGKPNPPDITLPPGYHGPYMDNTGHNYWCPPGSVSSPNTPITCKWPGVDYKDGAGVTPGGPPTSTPPGVTPTPPGTTHPPPGSTGGVQPPATSTNPGGGSSSAGGSTGSLPPDLAALRAMLSAYFGANFGNSMNPYPGNLTVSTDNEFMASLADVSKTGGIPDIQGAMDSIRTKSLLDLDRATAQTREQYGHLGLGAGSDVSYAIGQGQAQGIADMTKQQQSLLVDTLLKGAGNRVAAAGVGAQVQQGADTSTIQNQYTDYLRQTNPSPWLGLAESYATGFPPPQYPTTSGGALAATAGTSAMATIIAALIAHSDRNVKEDIVPLDEGSVVDNLLTLPISRWKYKGDPTPHLGPMAQDFTDRFGVGDGRHIHLVDVMGIMLAATKELAKTSRKAA